MNGTKRKFSAGAIGMAATVIVVWAVEEFSGLLIPAEVAGALGVLLVTGVSFLLPDELESD